MRRRHLSAITDGTPQDGRLAQPLGDHYFDVEERAFEDFVAAGAELAKTLPYYNANNVQDGTWRNLFSRDVAVVLADIITTDTSRMEGEFLPLLKKEPEHAAEHLAGFAHRIDGWYQHMLASDDDSARILARHIEVVVKRKLRDAMHQQVAPLLGRSRETLLDGFHPSWQLESAGAHPAAGPQHAHSALRSTFYSFVSAVSYLRPLAQERMAFALRNGNHDPALGLFFSFIKLLERAQEKVNTFTARHRDFYYGEVLRMEPKAAVPDTTFVVLEPDPTRPLLFVAAGTEFSAGKVGGSKVDLIYASDADLVVTDARIQSLRTLNLPRDPLISPERELHYVDGARSREIPTASPVVQPGTGAQSWPLFGANSPGTGMSIGRDAQVGFALASSALRLREGDREIEVTLSFRIPAASPKDDLGDQFRRLLFGYTRGTKQERDAALKQFREKAGVLFNKKDLLMQDPDYIFHRVVGSAFNIEFTVAGGWHAVHSYEVSLPASQSDEYQLTFSISLGPDAPAILGYDPAIHKGSFNTGFPVMRFLLNPRAAVYGYSLFRDITVEEITIQSKVEDAGRLIAWNQFGQLDTSKPFNPFGPLPTTNSYLILGSYDAASMNLTDLRINIEWGDLPNAPEGLGEYYRDYGQGYDNDAFRARMSVLRDGRWRPAPQDANPVAPLFATAPYSLRVANTRSIQMNVLRWFKRIDASLDEQQFRYDQKARAGFFRLELAGPESAFGHRDYPVLLTTAISENARGSKFRHQVRDVPPPPYTPVMNRVSFSYTGTASIGPGSGDAKDKWAEKVFIIHPFGAESVNANQPWVLLPVLQYYGNLYIGFSAAQAKGTLTLLFHLREDSATSIASDPEPVHWSYLASDTWIDLHDKQVISDTTDGFLSSGIVTLDVPGDINQNNTIMPSGLFWLRVSAEKNFASFCTVYSIRTQAVSVTRRLTEQAPTVLAQPLPARSIVRPVNSIPGLRSVLQPIVSSGGRQRETPPQQLTRTAERLRHKGRAVTPWDYERLVLEEFPDVFKVKCFSAMASENHMQPRPGCVLIVVVPHQPEHQNTPIFDPMLDAIKLKQIKEYLTPLASPHVRIEVRNPVYERIVVRCAVSLKPEYARERGMWLNRLNQEIVDYISPWSEVGPTPRFGWVFHNDEVEAFVRGREYVDYVTQFSMLHITENEKGQFRLGDTARWEIGTHEASPVAGGAQQHVGEEIPGEAHEEREKVSPRFPWGLAVPNPTHIIEGYDGSQGRVPVQTGIGKLRIGNSFILGRTRRDNA